MNILHRLRRQKQYYTAFLGGFATVPLMSGIIKRSIRFIRNKYERIIQNSLLPINLMISSREFCFVIQELFYSLSR